MHNKFDILIKEYISGTQNSINHLPTATISLSPFAGKGETPPDTGTGIGHTKVLKKALRRDKIRKNQNEKQIRKSIKQL